LRKLFKFTESSLWHTGQQTSMQRLDHVMKLFITKWADAE